MKPTWPDLSQIDDLTLEARIVDDVQRAAAALGVPVLVAGAFARDLHLLHGLGVETGRKTEDIDFALAVEDWDAFAALRANLLRSGQFGEAQGATAHRLIHRAGYPVDIVPFGAVETPDRHIYWPPGAFKMNVFGFREANEAAQTVQLPGGVDSRVVSLPALALLKLVAWQERHLTAPRKDAMDLGFVIEHYLDSCGTDRLWDECIHWTATEDFDFDVAGARMLGYDMGAMLSEAARSTVIEMVGAHLDPDSPPTLAIDMQPHEPGRALARMRALLDGLRDASPG